MTERTAATGVGARLRGLRESKRVGLRQIANTTKISVPALEAIERDEPGKLPGGIFGRSFVRAYARELGLDPDATAREFFGQFPELAEPADEPSDSRPAPSTATERAFALLSVAGLLVPVVAIAVWFYAGRATLDPPLPAARIPAVSTDIPAPRPTRAAADAVPAIGSVAEPVGDGPLTLHITARADCWISVVADGREVVSRLLTAGEDEAVRAESELRVKVGDATAVSLRLNGLPVRAVGRAGQVVTLRIDPSNASQWLGSH